MPFGKGSKGAGVKELQQKLDSWIKETNDLAELGRGSSTGLIGVIADGSFGQNTAVALATFQRFNGISTSGYADEFTLRLLGLDRDLNADGCKIITTTGGGIGGEDEGELIPGIPEET
jgi:peptidoglycan hydrolase-like protein with peptidoglycan-binding domain